MNRFFQIVCSAVLTVIAIGILSLSGCAHTMLATGWSNDTGISEIFDTTERISHAAGLSALSMTDDLPNDTERRVGQLRIHSDFPLAGQHRLIRELNNMRATISQELDLPVSDEPIHLYLFENPADYQAFVQRHFPRFPGRRACFIETDTTLAIFAPWQERIAEDLRHETTHGYLHAVVPGIPLWLDEGLAEFFEVPQPADGFHQGHADHLTGRLLEGTWQPRIARLEELEDAAAMSQDHYAEAWCWAHWLLRTTPQRRQVLEDYLHDLRRDPVTVPLSARLRELEGPPSVTTQAVRHHLESL
jgi:hypothetical protein